MNTSVTSSSKNKEVVILGAGFGGVYTAQALLPLVRRNEINLTIINETNYFLFTPLLHEVATGSLSPQSSAESLREMFAGEKVTIVQGLVESINQKEKTISLCSPKTSSGNTTPSSTISIPEIPNGPRFIAYDFLVVATGAITNYFGNTSAETNSLPLKNLADALRIKDRVIECFETASCKMNGTKNTSAIKNDQNDSINPLSFVVIGGGPTGVETVSELAEFIYGMEKRYMTSSKKTDSNTSQQTVPKPSVTLISAGKSILEQFHPSLQKKALNRLKKKGVTIKLESVAKEVTPEKVVLANGEEIPAHTVIWVAGVRPQAPTFTEAVAVNKGGRLIIDPYFRLADHENIFALGDVATLADKPLPMLAQVAVGQAQVVARNISIMIRKGNAENLYDFTYKSKGSLVSIGQRFAIGELGSRIRISGMIAWWLWRTVYLFKFVSWQKRFRIMFEWTLALFVPRDTTKAN